MNSYPDTASYGRLNIVRLRSGSLAGLPIEIPVFSIGQGKPKISIICGLHGDEPLGSIASQWFLEHVTCQASIHGTIQVVAVANPPAFAQGARVSSSDFLDLNRVGTGNSKGTLTERIAAMVAERIEDSDLIIDLHEFEMETPPLAIFISDNRWSSVQDTILVSIRAFAPELIWSIRYVDSYEVRYSESLIASMIRKKIPSFAIEVCRSGGRKAVSRLVDGLWRLATAMGIIDGEPLKSPVALKAYYRHLVTADFAGIWEPSEQLSLGQSVDSGQKVGRLSSLGFEEISEYTASNGMIMQLRSCHMVNTGDHLFSIGEIDQDVTDRFRALATSTQGCGTGQNQALHRTIQAALRPDGR